MQFYWQQPYGNSGQDAALLIATFSGSIVLPSEMGRVVIFDEPKKLAVKTFAPHLSRESKVGWAEKKSNMKEPIFISNEELVDASLTDLIKLLKSGSGGEWP